MLLDEIETLLDADPSFTPAQTLWKGTMPSSPDRCTTIYEYPGQQPVITHGPGLPSMGRPRIQIVSRAKDYPDARDDAQAAYEILAQVIEQTVGGSVLTIEVLQEPFVMGRDETDRVRIGFNAQVYRRDA
jgi:hypothetical protein